MQNTLGRIARRRVRRHEQSIEFAVTINLVEQDRHTIVQGDSRVIDERSFPDEPAIASRNSRRLRSIALVAADDQVQLPGRLDNNELDQPFGAERRS